MIFINSPPLPKTLLLGYNARQAMKNANPNANSRKGNRNPGWNRKKKVKWTHRVSGHFSAKDFQCRCGQCKGDIRVSMGLVGGLELLRTKLGSRINIKKGYMCPAAREKENALNRNFHAVGVAADIQAEGRSVRDIFMAAEAIPEFKGLGLCIDGDFVHVDTRKEPDRVVWVFDHGKKIPLTLENRAQFLGAPDPAAA
jgi:hypothetical protein